MPTNSKLTRLPQKKSDFKYIKTPLQIKFVRYTLNYSLISFFFLMIMNWHCPFVQNITQAG